MLVECDIRGIRLEATESILAQLVMDLRTIGHGPPRAGCRLNNSELLVAIIANELSRSQLGLLLENRGDL